MSGFMCCFWWFVAGVLVGWLLSWFLSKLFGGGDSGSSGSDARPISAYTPPVPAPAPAPIPTPAPAPVMDPKLAMIAAAASAGIMIKGEDDLQIVEGIGPKIDALLKESGIRTFAQLARADVPTISAILEKGGSRFKLANPGSWAQQAGLAATGKWHELKKLQDELVAGVRKSDDSES
jgi:predicted flap endonuclease-1-like 5' DNA nuclease